MVIRPFGRKDREFTESVRLRRTEAALLVLLLAHRAQMADAERAHHGQVLLESEPLGGRDGKVLQLLLQRSDARVQILQHRVFGRLRGRWSISDSMGDCGRGKHSCWCSRWWRRSRTDPLRHERTRALAWTSDRAAAMNHWGSKVRWRDVLCIVQSRWPQDGLLGLRDRRCVLLGRQAVAQVFQDRIGAFVDDVDADASLRVSHNVQRSQVLAASQFARDLHSNQTLVSQWRQPTARGAFPPAASCYFRWTAM